MAHKISQKDQKNAEKKYHVDEEQIRTFWKIITLQGKCKNYKFQTFKKDGTVSKSIDVDNADRLIELCKKHNLQGISCISVNPRLREKTKTDSVIAITGILFDVDVKAAWKKDGVSTPQDKAVAKRTAMTIIKELEEAINLRVSLLVDSGNGYHIWVPIFISLEGFFTSKNDDENKELWDNSEIKGRLLHLADLLKEKFDNDVTTIDCISADIARRVKIPGTWNIKKGISEADYRRAEIVKSHEDALTDLLIESNTKVFNHFKPEREEKKEIIHDIPANGQTELRPCFQAIIRRKIQLKGGAGHNLRYAFLNELVACGRSDTKIHEAFKSQDDYNYKKVQYRIEELRKKGKITPYKCETLKKKFQEIGSSPADFCDKCPFEIKRKKKKENIVKIIPSKISAKLEGKDVEVTGRIIAEKRKKAIPSIIAWECRRCDENCIEELPVFDKETFIFRGKHPIIGVVAEMSETIGRRIKVDCKRKEKNKDFTPSWFGNIKEYDDYNILWLSDRLEDQADFKASENKMKVALVGTEAPIGRIVRINGKVVVDPYSADLVVLANEINEVETSAENLVLDEKMKSDFIKYFRDNGTKNLRQIAPDMVGHDMARLSRLLVLHSPIWINDLNGKKIRGCIRENLFGDTKTYKSQSVKDIIDKYHFGEWCSSETGSRSGLLFYVDTDKKTIAWCILPLNDKGYVGLESINILKGEEWSRFREVLEDMRVKVVMAIQGAANVRTRMSVTMNPPKPMGEYLCKCQAIVDTYVFKHLPDITRWDIWLPFALDDVNQEEIVDRGEIKRPIPDDVFMKHVYWSWSLPPDNIIIENKSKEIIKRETKKIMNEYQMDALPVVHPATRDVITRLSVAMAILNHSTEDCITVMVRPRDVEEAVTFYTNMLEDIELRTYKNMMEGETYVDKDEMEEIASKFEKEHFKILNLIMARSRGAPELARLLNISEKTVKRKYEILKEFDLIKAVRGKGITLTRRGVFFVKKLMNIVDGKKTQKTVTRRDRDTFVPLSLMKLRPLSFDNIYNKPIDSTIDTFLKDNAENIDPDTLDSINSIYTNDIPRILSLIKDIIKKNRREYIHYIENKIEEIKEKAEELKKEDENTQKKDIPPNFTRDKGTSVSLATEVGQKIKKSEEDVLLVKIIELMQTKPRRDWKINDICDGLGIAGLQGRKKISSILWNVASDPKNPTPIRRVDEEGLFWRLVEAEK